MWRVIPFIIEKVYNANKHWLQSKRYKKKYRIILKKKQEEPSCTQFTYYTIKQSTKSIPVLNTNFHIKLTRHPIIGINTT